MREHIAPFLKITGLLLIAYSLIREAFAHGVPASLGTAPEPLAPFEELMFRFGGALDLIPTQYALSTADHRIDAMLAVLGFVLLAVGSLIALVHSIRHR